ncbi:MAG: response regulator [Burkholderiales bacterium]|nr:response regulator [Burkholderiales bacterium]
MNSDKTVLVVDDSRVSRMLSRQFILAKHPTWKVEEAATGEEAVEKLDSLAPDLIILDVNMPGMGGFAAVDKLREKRPNVRISLLTANVQDAVRNRAGTLNVDFAEKPITEARIGQIISVLES